MSQTWNSFYIWSLSNKIIIVPGTVHISSKYTIKQRSQHQRQPLLNGAGWDTAASVTSNKQQDREWILHSQLAYQPFGGNLGLQCVLKVKRQGTLPSSFKTMGTINKYQLKQLMLPSDQASTPAQQQSSAAERSFSAAPQRRAAPSPPRWTYRLHSRDGQWIHESFTLLQPHWRWGKQVEHTAKGMAGRKQQQPTIVSNHMQHEAVRSAGSEAIPGGSSFGLSLTRGYTKFPIQSQMKFCSQTQAILLKCS